MRAESQIEPWSASRGPSACITCNSNLELTRMRTIPTKTAPSQAKPKVSPTLKSGLTAKVKAPRRSAGAKPVLDSRSHRTRRS